MHSLTLHFKGSFGADFTEIHFIGLKGDFTEVRASESLRPSVSSSLTALGLPSRPLGASPHLPTAPACVPLQRKRQAVEAVYEVRAMPEDHKIPGENQNSHDVA